MTTYNYVPTGTHSAITCHQIGVSLLCWAVDCLRSTILMSSQCLLTPPRSGEEQPTLDAGRWVKANVCFYPWQQWLIDKKQALSPALQRHSLTFNKRSWKAKTWRKFLQIKTCCWVTILMLTGVIFQSKKIKSIVLAMRIYIMKHLLSSNSENDKYIRNSLSKIQPTTMQ